MKTSELIGPALDWAVCIAEGDELAARCIQYPQYAKNFAKIKPSTDWALAGPIIEREWIAITPWPNEINENTRWSATQFDAPNPTVCFGPTALIAAMRCYVASKLGDTVDLPEELR